MATIIYVRSSLVNRIETTNADVGREEGKERVDHHYSSALLAIDTRTHYCCKKQLRQAPQKAESGGWREKLPHDLPSFQLLPYVMLCDPGWCTNLWYRMILV